MFARGPGPLDVLVDGEAGAVGEGGRGPEQGPPHPELCPGVPGPGLRGVGGRVQPHVVTDQGAHAGEARHEVTYPLIRVQRELSAREENPDTRGTLLSPLERKGVGESGILAVPD